LPGLDIELGSLSDGELLDLAVPSQSLNRRVLVMWVYLKTRPQQSLDDFDSIITGLAEKELQKRAITQRAL
jgi:hypothetical protein